MVKSFEHTAQAGDIVLLRSGVKKILGIGVLGPYDYIDDMGIAAWDLYHVRSTTWLDEDETAEWFREAAAKGPFEQSDRRDLGLPSRLAPGRFYLLKSEGWRGELRDQAIEAVSARDLKPPSQPPSRPKPLKKEDFLAEAGFPRPAEDLQCEELDRLLDAASEFSEEEGYNRAEADTIAMIIVPLLRALGLSDRHIRVEVPLKAFGVTEEDSTKRVDVAVIGGSVKEPRLLIEVKRRWTGLDYAADQGGNYRERIRALNDGGQPLPLVLTDGAEFEIIGLRPDRPDDSNYLSLRWLDKDGAQTLAELADYLST
jgi:hypothetical protein